MINSAAKTNALRIILGVFCYLFGIGNAAIGLFGVLGDFPHEIIGSLMLGAFLAECINLKYFHNHPIGSGGSITVFAGLYGILHFSGYLSMVLVSSGVRPLNAISAIDWIHNIMILGYLTLVIGCVTSGFFIFSLFLISEYHNCH